MEGGGGSRSRTSFRARESDDDGGGDGVHFVLIEGVGGGAEERLFAAEERRKGKRRERASPGSGGATGVVASASLPHRGRIVEVPGEVMKGRWAAEVVTERNDGGNPQSYKRPSEGGGCCHPASGSGAIRSVGGWRVSLRHETFASLGDLNRLLLLDTGDTSASGSAANSGGGDVTVCVVNPNHNRVLSFLSQGILDDTEVEVSSAEGKKPQREADGQKGARHTAVAPHIASVTVSTFSGFSSSSESTINADAVGGKILADCRREHRRRHRHHPLPKFGEGGELLGVPAAAREKRIAGRERGRRSMMRGVTFPCKVDLDEEYYCLIGVHNLTGEIVAFDSESLILSLRRYVVSASEEERWPSWIIFRAPSPPLPIGLWDAISISPPHVCYFFAQPPSLFTAQSQSSLGFRPRTPRP